MPVNERRDPVGHSLGNVAFVGIDPSAHASGYCVSTPTERVIGATTLTRVAEVVQQWPIPADMRLVVAIECDTRMYRGSSHVVRTAANLWVEELTKAFPRRVSYAGTPRTVPPNVWRGVVLANVPSVTGTTGRDEWKSKALWYAEKVAGVRGITDDMAEAICLTAYAFSVGQTCKQDHIKKKRSKP